VNGKVTVRVLVDRSSVEVFGGKGQAVVTSLVFPDAAGDEVKVFSGGGRARIDRLALAHGFCPTLTARGGGACSATASPTRRTS